MIPGPTTGTDEAMRAVTALARDEAAALRAGDLAALEEIGTRKAALMARLRPRPQDAAALSGLRDRLRDNARLYEAALAGIATARARLAGIAEGGTGLMTYDRAGQLAATTGDGPGFARRV